MGIRSRLLVIFIAFVWNSIALASDGGKTGAVISSGSEFTLPKNTDALLRDYRSVYQTYFKQLCPAGTEEKYWELYRQFSGDGHYIPVLESGKLDRLTVNKFIPELKDKKKWIDSLIAGHEKWKSFSDLKEMIKEVEGEIDFLLKLKEQLTNSTDKNSTLLKNKNKFELLKFRDKILELAKQVPFLMSYRHPVDHFDLRLSYDNYKDALDDTNKRRSNEIYFYRKIVQDGAQDSGGKRSDRFMRSVWDTLILKLQKPLEVLDENTRYDVEWALSALDLHLSKGKSQILRRLEEWAERTARTIEFYESLNSDKVKVHDHFESAAELLSNREKARYILKDFVLRKEKEAYEFWARRPALLQALFVLETILYNEVGGLDGRDALERRDVAQVVINRHSLSEYNQITAREPLYSYLMSDEESKIKPVIKANTWLNVMLKEGEFSFSYFFIPGSLRIFCPDQTNLGRFLQRENLEIALSLLGRPESEFEAVRYFSRASMQGRIDMAGIWTEFEPIDERPGFEANGQKRLLRYYTKGKYRFFYRFKSRGGVSYDVVEIDGKTVVLDRASKKFYKYRNPHFFRYFKVRPVDPKAP